MNQSSLSVTDVGKSSALLSAGSSSVKQSGETSESESFLSKLGSIFKSDEKAASNSEVDTETKPTKTDAKQASTGVEQAAIDAKSAEAVAELGLADTEEAAGEQEETAQSKSATEKGETASTDQMSDENLIKATTTAELNKSTEPEKTAEVMKPGNELLERLDGASQALQKPSGKDLPPQESSQQAGKADHVKQDVMAKYIQQPKATDTLADGKEVEGKQVEGKQVEGSQSKVQLTEAKLGDGKPDAQVLSAESVKQSVFDEQNTDTGKVSGVTSQLKSIDQTQMTSESEVTAQEVPGQTGLKSANVADVKVNSQAAQQVQAGHVEVESTQKAEMQPLQGQAGVGVEVSPKAGQQYSESQEIQVNQKDVQLTGWNPQAGHAEQLSNAAIQGEKITPNAAEAKAIVSEGASPVNPLIWDAPQNINGGVRAEHLSEPQQQNSSVTAGINPQQLAELQKEMSEVSITSDGEWHELLPTQQAGVSAELGKQAIDLSKQQPDQITVNQQARNHQLQQMGQMQHSALQQANMADKQALSQAITPTPVAAELNAANLQAVNPAQVSAAQTSNNQNLKAALAATTAAGAVKGMRSGKGEAKEAELSQQLAGMAGQQGVQQTQARAEIQQAAAQSPLQLSQNMAGDELAERVQMMLSKNLKNIDIRLDPPELGRMQIRMTMNNDIASVQFTVANPQARDMVENAMPRLREMLSQQGIQLADTSVQQQNSGQQRQYASENGSGGSGRHQGQGGDESLNLDESINLDVNIASKDDGISYYA